MSRPKLKYFLQCDEVRNDQGKFSAVGIFDTIFSFIFPANHKQFYLLAGFTGQAGKHELELHVTGPDGRVLGTTKGLLELESEDHVSNVVFGFENFPLPVQGRYKLSLFMDGDFLVEYPFTATAPPRRERSAEEIAELVKRPDVISSANADIECNRCRSTYKFQLHLDPNASTEPGFMKLPPGDSFLCGKCGNEIPLNQVRQNLENIIGIPKEWLVPRQPERGPAPESIE